MEIKNNNRREELMQSLQAVAKKKLNKSQLRQFDQFIASAMHFYPDENYLSRPIEHIFSSLWELFSFGTIRDSHSYSKVKVFNPDQKLRGWTDRYTTIFINQPDIPFLVDSLRIVFNRRGLNIYTLQSRPVWVLRDQKGAIQSTEKDYLEGAEREVFISAEVDRHTEDELADLSREVMEAMEDVRLVVDDFDPMRLRIKSLIDELQANGANSDELDETVEFLRWMYRGYFTFIGCVDFKLEVDGAKQFLTEVPSSRFGLLKKYSGETGRQSIDVLNPKTGTLRRNHEILNITKSPERFGIHRDVYADYLVVKRLNAEGNPVGEVRFLGLYTSQFYSYSPQRIPILREKVSWVIKHSGFDPRSHDGKALLAILDFHPRDELFHVSREALTDTAIGVWQIYEQRSTKVFVHPDPLERFVSCIVYIPREAFSKNVRERIQSAIGERLGASESEFSAQFLPESVLVRIYLVYQVRGLQSYDVDTVELETLVKDITRNWSDDFREAAISIYKEAKGLVAVKRFQQAFPAAYKDLYSPPEALEHIALFDALEDDGQLAIDLQHRQGTENKYVQLKLFHRDEPLELSTMIPMLENLGFRVVMEHPYLIQEQGASGVWMQEFYLSFSLDVDVDVSAVQCSFKDALSNIWKGEAENDSFNRLIIGARLDWRAVAMLRLYARYLKQLGISFSQEFIADTLSRYPDITRNLVALFKSYFDPRYVTDSRADRSAGLVRKIHRSLDAVENINEDSLIRDYLEVIEATLRTNFFQTFDGDIHKPYISVKLETEKISLAPKPRPVYEIFVYSSRMEGVHLRGGKVARGGLRWSDRIEDYRTEILGLVKAQQVKNAVIVPAGAKGGFVAKQASMAAGRESWLKEGIASYGLYIQALLDITDNLINGQIVAPIDVVRRDSDDPYLVVAADKGTATFSDIANEISLANNFWLGDAFASGGCNGYDHKSMGITARGAWVAVHGHFRGIAMDIQQQDFTVMGIGGMGGDVFGNGMLLSEHIQLVAAFNHSHIFIDPDPDAAKTFIERKRLFTAPKSTWDDFDKALLSVGGAVYSRSAKSLELTPEIKARFEIVDNRVTPIELIKMLLKSKVDLIWNGGIGTYVKSSLETDIDVGDRANDGLRINGNELRCRVFGEGGNLGMTQYGRIEYCFNGGLCNTDFIDNAAGVDCSDHEVNIKILLNKQVLSGKLSVEERNQFLALMTDSVVNLVLHNNARATQAISLALHCKRQYPEYQRFISWLEQAQKLDRDLEFLPTDEQLKERSQRGQLIWTRPELSVLVCYSKVRLKELLLDAQLLTDPWLTKSLNHAFPAEVVDRYGSAVAKHPLCNQIASTQLANDVVDRGGLSFFFHQMESTGASAGEIIRAYTIAINIFEVDRLWREIENEVGLTVSLQLNLLQTLIELIRRASRWFLCNRKANMDCEQIIGEFTSPMRTVIDYILQLSNTQLAELWSADRKRLVELGVEDQLAARIALFKAVSLSPGIVDAALQNRQSVERVAKLHCAVGECLSLDWFMLQIMRLESSNRWQDLARESYIDDLEIQRHQLIACLLDSNRNGDIQLILQSWQERQYGFIERWKSIIADLRQVATLDFSMIAVALKELRYLLQSSAEDFKN
ncbi:MAG: NAD-glutamate dehydrogenase [Porticoccaceae bacterium]|nr:NAD-glutamate dehydrogenase [Porticoccaceae bacterium]